MTEAYPLFRAPEAGGDAVLVGGRCRKCGTTFFPMQTYGCEKCGQPAEGLEAAELAAKGRLVAWSEVHLHAADTPKTPFTAIVVKLADGPTIRALLDPPTDSGLRAGQQLSGRVVDGRMYFGREAG